MNSDSLDTKIEKYKKGNTINNLSNKEALSEPNLVINKKNNNYLNDYYSSEESKNMNRGQNMLTVSQILGEDINKEINLDVLDVPFPNFFPGKVSTKSYGLIKAYAANTNQGITRDYNEDRVSLNINISKNISEKCINKEKWPKASFFGIFDGHGGSKCADFLRDNLLRLICENNYYPDNIIKAIKYGFNEADEIFLKLIEKEGKIIDSSGSCCLILLIIERKIYIANVGDSRSIISKKNGIIRKDVTRDHKPNYPYEKERIIINGGRTYQTQTLIDPNNENDEIIDENNININSNNLILLGPYRVFPGSLSVSRTIGDPNAKLPFLGGNPKVVISNPDIYTFDVEKEDIDFVILGCDGIYDHLTSKEVLDCAWMVIDKNRKLLNENNNNEKNKKINLNNTCGNIVDFIIKMSMTRKSFDNVSCLIVAFKDLLNIDDKINKNNNINLEEKVNYNNILVDETFPKLRKKISDILMVGNNEKSNDDKKNNKNKMAINKIKIKDIEKSNKLYNKNIKMFSFEANHDKNEINNLDLDEVSHRFTKNNLLQEFKNKESSEHKEYDYLKYKHKIALSIKKSKKSKKYDLDNNNNDYGNNFLIINSNKKINNLSNNQKKLNITRNFFLNKKIKPLLIDNKFSLCNNNKLTNNLTLGINQYNQYNKDKKTTQNIQAKSPNNNIKKDNYIIDNYNSKLNNFFLRNKLYLNNNINTLNLNMKNKNISSLNNLLALDREKKDNTKIRLKTFNKKSISYSNNALDEQNNSRKKSNEKNSFQKNKKEKIDIYSLNHIKNRNSISNLKGENTVNLKKHINIDLLQISKGIKTNKLFKSNNNSKNLVHNLTEDLLLDNKQMHKPINFKNKINIFNNKNEREKI